MTGHTLPERSRAAMRLEWLRFDGYNGFNRIAADGDDAASLRLRDAQGEVRQLHLRPPPGRTAPALQSGAKLQEQWPLPVTAGSDQASAQDTPGAATHRHVSKAGGAKVEAEAPLVELREIAEPPEGFEVEFIASSSSSATSSSSSSPSRTLAPVTSRERELPLQPAEESKGKPIMQEDCESRPRDGVANAFRMKDNAATPSSVVHGSELVVSAVTHAEFHNEVAMCAHALGRNAPPPASTKEDGDDTRRCSCRCCRCEALLFSGWPELVHYCHGVVLLGYDDEGFAYLDAQPAVQRLLQPPGWALSPLPLLVCTVTMLAHYFEEREAVSGEEMGGGGPLGRMADAKPQRYPVLPRCTTASREGSVGAACQQPGDDPTNAILGASASHPTPVPTLTRKYLSPPLRWTLPACAFSPALDLREMFCVRPGHVYRLVQSETDVVFLGVACGVPWCVSVVPADAATPTRLAATTRGHTPSADPALSASSASPDEGSLHLLPLLPSGYRIKDTPWVVEPQIGCYDADALRKRLIDQDTPYLADLASLSAPSTALHSGVARAVGATKLDRLQSGYASGEATHQVTAEDAAMAQMMPRPSPQNSKGSVSSTFHPSASSLPSPPPVPPVPWRRAHAGAAEPRFVKDGARVFVTGPYGVMKECSADPAALESLFGVVHGDCLMLRSTASRDTIAALLSPVSAGTHSSVGPPTPMVVWRVMGWSNRTTLMLLADEGAEAAVPISIHHGVQEMQGLFRKVAGAVLPPPALPLEPLTPQRSRSRPADATKEEGLATVGDACRHEKDWRPSFPAGSIPNAIEELTAKGEEATQPRETSIRHRQRSVSMGSTEDTDPAVSQLPADADQAVVVKAPSTPSGEEFDAAPATPGRENEMAARMRTRDSSLVVRTSAYVKADQRSPPLPLSEEPLSAARSTPPMSCSSTQEKPPGRGEDAEVPRNEGIDESEGDADGAVALSLSPLPSSTERPLTPVVVHGNGAGEINATTPALPRMSVPSSSPQGSRGLASSAASYGHHQSPPAKVEDTIAEEAAPRLVSPAAEPPQFSRDEDVVERATAVMMMVMPDVKEESGSAPVEAHSSSSSPPPPPLLERPHSPSIHPIPCAVAELPTLHRLVDERNASRMQTKSHTSLGADSTNSRSISPSFAAAPSPAPKATSQPMPPRALSTPFTNFMKAYAVYSLHHQTEMSCCKGGGRTDVGLRASPQGDFGKTQGADDSARGPANDTVEQSQVFDFYLEKPLMRISEATAKQRHCRVMWAAEATATTETPLRTLMTSASTKAFDDLSVEELVQVLHLWSARR